MHPLSINARCTARPSDCRSAGSLLPCAVLLLLKGLLRLLADFRDFGTALSRLRPWTRLRLRICLPTTMPHLWWIPATIGSLSLASRRLMKLFSSPLHFFCVAFRTRESGDIASYSWATRNTTLNTTCSAT